MITTLGYQIIAPSLLEGLLTALMVCLWVPSRWFRGGCLGLFEQAAFFLSLWLWLSIGWALLFAWPFIERGLVE